MPGLYTIIDIIIQEKFGNYNQSRVSLNNHDLVVSENG